MKRFIFILLCVATLLPIDAQNIIHPKIAGPNGLWVNSYNGVLFFGRTDCETQNSAMPMQLRFYYNSSAAKIDYGYGLGFSMGYEMRYEVDDDGNVTIESGDGRADTYTRYGDDFEAPAGVFNTLTLSDGTYTLTEKTGEKYEFANADHKKVTAQQDRHGNRTTLSYTPDSLLTRIEDAVGHAITLEYSDKLLTRATATFLNGAIGYTYDAKRRLIKVTDAMGFTTVYDYDNQGHLDEITDAEGHKTVVSYNASGMAARIKTEVSDKSIRYDGDKTVFIDYTEPTNQYSYYRWDDKGRVIEKVGLCCGMQSQMEYDEDDNVIKRTDANGNITTYTYDDRGNMLSMTDAAGHTERYTYDPVFNQVTSFIDRNGNAYTLSYNGKGDMTSIDGPLGFSNRFTYDDHGWALTNTDANGNVSRIDYNADGTIASTMDAAGNTTTFTYDQNGNIASLTDARNNTMTYGYDRNNRLTSQTDPLGNKSTISYDKKGNIVRVKNALNQITAFTYDPTGNVLTQTNPQGGVTEFTYDGKGNVITMTDANGDTQTFTWNDRDKLLSQTNAAGEKTSFDYDAAGNLITVLQPNGNVLSYFYDNLDRVEMVSDNLGIVARYTYDAAGNLLSATDAMGRTTTSTYDALNRVIASTLPSGATTRYEYDANSNVVGVTDALGNVTRYAYSALNQQMSVTDALNGLTRLEYDAVGNLIRAIDDKGNATSYAYDALNRNTVITFANGLSQRYAYDAAGRIKTYRDRAGHEFKMDYDALGNLLVKSYPDGAADVYTYDAVGKMLTAVNKEASVEFTYDRAGRMLSESLNGKVTSYAYDIAAGKRSLTYPGGMRVVEQLNARGQIVSILQNGTEVVNMSYDEAGMKVSQGYANGVTTAYKYNENGWLNEIQADHNVLSLRMTYDAIGNITKREDLLDANRTESYGYDKIGQLTSFKRGTALDKSYEFDLLGNRVRSLDNGAVTTYTTNNVNAYTRVSGGLDMVPQYDDNGNLLNDGKHNYAYDFNNRLVGVDNGAADYKYDALGRRISKNGTLFYYDGDQMVEEVINGVTTTYLYGDNIDEVLQMKRGDAVYYYHTNHLGSTMALTDATGAVAERVDYDAYGEPTFYDAAGNVLAQSSVGNNILFTGREYDTETGNYYYRARSMHPGLGRFMQKDPLMYVDGLNDFLYAINSPIMDIDPSGEVVITTSVIVITLIAANIGAWSTYVKNRKFSVGNTSSAKAFYGAFKGGSLAFMGAILPGLAGAALIKALAIKALLAANFAAWETYYNEDCGTFSVSNTSSGKVAYNASIAGVTDLIDSRIGLSKKLSGLEKFGSNVINDTYSDALTTFGNRIFDGEDVNFEVLSNDFSDALNKSFVQNSLQTIGEDIAESLMRPMPNLNPKFAPPTPTSVKTDLSSQKFLTQRRHQRMHPRVNKPLYHRRY